MSGAYNPRLFKLLDELPSNKYQSSMQRQPQEAQAQEQLMRPDTQKATAAGMQSGGVSGALMAGGVQSMIGSGSMSAAMAGMGPYAIGAGLLLSELEASKNAKAAQEQERIANEKNRQNRMQSAFSSMANSKFGA